jgi:hypothetical protein
MKELLARSLPVGYRKILPGRRLKEKGDLANNLDGFPLIQ